MTNFVCISRGDVSPFFDSQESIGSSFLVDSNNLPPSPATRTTPITPGNVFTRELLKPEFAQSIGEEVLCVIGKDTETTNRYLHRTRALVTLPKALPANEIEALLAHLAGSTENDPPHFPIRSLPFSAVSIILSRIRDRYV